MTSLEVKEDGQIWLIPDCPKEPNYSEYFEFSCASVRRDYQKVIASAERILVSDQEVAKALLSEHHFFNAYTPDRFRIPGIYPIPDLKWEVKENYYGGIANWYKVAIISHPSEIIQEDEKNGMYEDDLITEIDDIVGGTPFNVLIYPDRVILTEKRDGHPVKVTEYTRNPPSQ